MSAPFPEAISRARRATAGGRALFGEGLVPECHEYMVSALRALLEAWEPAEATAHSAGSEPALEARALRAAEQAGYRDAARLRAAWAATTNVAPPSPGSIAELPGDVDWIWAEVERFTRFTVRHFSPPATRRRARARTGVALGAVLVLALTFAVRLRSRPHAQASASFSEYHLASNAIDGLDATEWLLPEASPGWIDIIFGAPRTLDSVRLVNAHNVYYADRASHELRVTAFSDERPVASIGGAFAALTQKRSVLDLTLHAERVTRVRVEVLSFFGRGGGLAEVEAH